MAHDVFVSYSSKDKPVADAAAAALEGRGIRCWIAPRDIVAGVDWSEAIIEAINDCRVMLLVFSRNANESHQIKREVERAVAKGVPVIPLRIEDVPLAKSLEYFISMPHWIDALTPERQQRLDYLAETVGLLLERQAGRADARAATPRPSHVTATPRPASSSRRWLVIAPLAIAIVAIAAFVARRPDPAPAPPEPAPRAREDARADQPASDSRRGNLDPRLVGDWAATVTSQGVTTRQRMTVRPDGHVRWEVALTDSGTMQAGNGGILQTSREHGTTLALAYAFKGPDLVAITGPLGSADWRRARPGGGGGAAFDGRLSGTWASTTVDPKGNAWRSTLEMAPTGAYTFRSELVEEGKLRTTGLRWAVQPPSGAPPREGDMSFEGDDVVVMRQDASGEEARWKRRP